ERGGGLAADTVELDELVYVARDDDADRRHPVVRRVGGAEGAAAGVETHLSLDRRAQLGRERAAVDLLHRGHAAAEAGVDALGDGDAHDSFSFLTLGAPAHARRASDRGAARRLPARARRRR